MSNFTFSTRSENNLKGVNADLVKVVRRALELTTQDFVVVEGLRTKERQAELVKSGASKTSNSKHLIGHAVDLAPFVEGKISWDWTYFYAIAEAMREAAKELDIKIRWGGTWSVLNDTTEPADVLVSNYTKERKRLKKSAFTDGPHYELV